MTAPGGGEVRDQDKVLLDEIIEKFNELFGGGLSDSGAVALVDGIEGKLPASDILVQQAENNTFTLRCARACRRRPVASLLMSSPRRDAARVAVAGHRRSPARAPRTCSRPPAASAL